MTHHATVGPVKIRYHSDELAVKVLRGVGYRGSCDCGWTGPKRGGYMAAREDARIHVSSCEGASPLKH